MSTPSITINRIEYTDEAMEPRILIYNWACEYLECLTEEHAREVDYLGELYEELAQYLTVELRQWNLENASSKEDKGKRIPPLKSLPSDILVAIAAKRMPMAMLASPESETKNGRGCLYSYNFDHHVWVCEKQSYVRDLIIGGYPLTSGVMQIKGQIVGAMQSILPTLTMVTDENIIPVANGDFNYKTKELLPFDPYERPFTYRIPVELKEDAENPIIVSPDGETWDMEGWLYDLASENEDMYKFFWQIIGSVTRPNVSWNHALLFINTNGNNGKGTLCELMRSLVGRSNVASLSIAQFGERFSGYDLKDRICCIADENDGYYLENARLFKSAITGDVIRIEQKTHDAEYYRYRGAIIQCVNELPKLTEKNESIYRRLIVVPFHRCFEGCENKAIKNDYIKRPEVLEYVLKKVLIDSVDEYEYEPPEECKAAMADFQEDNDAVVEFWRELRDRFVWDLIPYNFLYDLYKSWLKEARPNDKLIKRRDFITRLQGELRRDGEWWYSFDKYTRFRHAGTHACDKPERLIAEYNLEKWKSPSYSGTNVDNICMPLLPERIYGIIRCNTPMYNAAVTSDTSKSEDA